MFLEKNKQQMLAESTEIVVKAAIDVLDKNAPSIAKVIMSFLDAMGEEAGKRVVKESEIEEGMESVGEFLSGLFGAGTDTIKRKQDDGFGPEGYV